MNMQGGQMTRQSSQSNSSVYLGKQGRSSADSLRLASALQPHMSTLVLALLVNRS